MGNQHLSTSFPQLYRPYIFALLLVPCHGDHFSLASYSLPETPHEAGNSSWVWEVSDIYLSFASGANGLCLSLRLLELTWVSLGRLVFPLVWNEQWAIFPSTKVSLVSDIDPKMSFFQLWVVCTSPRIEQWVMFTLAWVCWSSEWHLP